MGGGQCTWDNMQSQCDHVQQFELTNAWQPTHSHLLDCPGDSYEDGNYSRAPRVE
jgi:hypothetical protein